MSHYQRRIGVDFDGVIHRARKGRLDGSIYDEPNFEVLDGIRSLLSDGYIVFVYSARNSHEIFDWMNSLQPKLEFPLKIIPQDAAHWDEINVLGITRKKYAALIYIDDHGFHFSGSWTDAMQEWQRRIRKLS